MKLYYDADLKKEIVGPIKIGRVKAGSSGSIVVYVHNEFDNIAYEDIKLKAVDKTVSVTPEIKVIGPKLTTSIIVTWSAPLTLKKALKTELNIYMNKIYLVTES